MTKRLLLITAFLLPAVGAVAQSNALPDAYMQTYNQLIHLVGDGTRIAAVKGLTVKRDVATFAMEDGVLYLCSPVAQRTCAAIFIGKGTFLYSPPTDVEKKQLGRFYDRESLEEKFKVLFLAFADTTLEELLPQLSFAGGKVPREVNDQITYAVNYLSDGGKGHYFDPSFLATFLVNEHNSLFYAHISNNKLEPMFFRIDPYDVEEVSFGRRNLSWPGYDREMINQFHTHEEYETGADQEDVLTDRISITKYSIDACIKKNLDFSAVAKLVFTSLKKNQRWIDLSLYPRLEVDSVFWLPHRPAQFVDDVEHYPRWVFCDSALRLGQVCSLLVCYHGDLLRQDDNARLYLGSSSVWYPRHGFRSRATYDLTFRYPSRYTFLSVGTRVSAREEDDDTLARWVSAAPIKGASFNFGLFNEYVVGDSIRSLISTASIALPPIAVYMSKGLRRSPIYSIIPTVSAVSREDMAEQVKNDIARSTSFFQTVLGGSPFDHLTVSEIPDMHGEAFPGMVNLSWGTYEYTGTLGSEEIFRAHEVAHQWWGIGVGFKSYHDQWLSEGLSEYSGIWYMQASLRNNEVFFRVLDVWKGQILNNRVFVLGKGQEAGPVWLGYRTLSSRTRGDYDLIIYKKGAWVLHMLRNMMLDLRTLKEDRFNAMMADFYKTYRNHDVSTLDFQRVVEKHFGSDMTWFFDQWVRGTNIPSYQFSHKTVKIADTAYTVRIRIHQQNVPPGFRMLVPLQVKLADGSAARFRINVTGENMEFDLPAMPAEPGEIVFNYLDSVLCESEVVKWD